MKVELKLSILSEESFHSTFIELPRFGDKRNLTITVSINLIFGKNLDLSTRKIVEIKQ